MRFNIPNTIDNALENASATWGVVRAFLRRFIPRGSLVTASLSLALASVPTHAPDGYASDSTHVHSPMAPDRSMLAQPEELGGYFIINGNEKLIRLLILPRRNYVCTLSSSVVYEWLCRWIYHIQSAQKAESSRISELDCVEAHCALSGALVQFLQDFTSPRV